jgi:hypothetical protein
VDYKYREIVSKLSKYYENMKNGKSTDKKENETENKPALHIEESYFHFKNVPYNTSITKVLEIRNIGSISCEFFFVNENGGKENYSKKYLSISPNYGIILPGKF